MPPPAVVYVAAVVSTIAAAIAFKEFIYEPHIAPKLEQWAAQFIAHRQALRRQSLNKSATASAHSLPSVAPAPASAGVPSKKSDTSGPVDDGSNDRYSYELEKLVATELDDWRRDVAGSSQVRARHRGHGSTAAHSLHEAHSGTPGTPSFVIASPATSPKKLSSNHAQLNRPSTSTLRSSASISTRLACESSVRGSTRSRNPSIVSHDISRAHSDIDHELLSVSSRPESPFIPMSAPRSPSASVVGHPPLSQVDYLSPSDDDLEIFSLQSTSSVVSVDENVRDDGSVWSLASSTLSH